MGSDILPPLSTIYQCFDLIGLAPLPDFVCVGVVCQYDPPKLRTTSHRLYPSKVK